MTLRRGIAFVASALCAFAACTPPETPDEKKGGVDPLSNDASRAPSTSDTTPDASADAPPDDAFDGVARPLSSEERTRMTGVSWRAECPVGLDDLVVLDMPHVGFDAQPHRGQLVVAKSVADTLLGVFRALYTAKFPIERIVPVDAYDADDDRSMADNNTSAFNCRRVTGGASWSAHSYGTAIDLNPVQNPYVRGSTVLPPAGAAYQARDATVPGVVVASGPVVQAFDAIGWGWGGRWTSLKDYQHFSEDGR